VSAGLGSVRSMINVGWRYYRTIGTLDLKKALFWMKRAAKIEGDYQGYALNNLAVMYEEGYAFQRDRKVAIKLYKRAEKLGNKWSANNLGRLNLLGDGVKRNHALARDYFQRAISRGPSKTANFYLSMMEKNNHKNFVDNDQIRKVMLKVLFDGNDAGYEQLGWFFRTHKKIEAAKWFWAGACLGGDETVRVENKQHLNLMYQLFLSSEELRTAKDRLNQFYQKNINNLKSKSHCRFLG
jgi:TPR repeat protein